jgi:hypothetical protein
MGFALKDKEARRHKVFKDYSRVLARIKSEADRVEKHMIRPLLVSWPLGDSYYRS